MGAYDHVERKLRREGRVHEIMWGGNEGGRVCMRSVVGEMKEGGMSA